MNVIVATSKSAMKMAYQANFVNEANCDFYKWNAIVLICIWSINIGKFITFVLRNNYKFNIKMIHSFFIFCSPHVIPTRAITRVHAHGVYACMYLSVFLEWSNLGYLLRISIPLNEFSTFHSVCAFDCLGAQVLQIIFSWNNFLSYLD